MILEKKDKQAISKIRLERADEFLSDAEATYKDKRYKTSVNRSYYAALSALRGLLILDGVNPESHEGVVTMFSLRFIKTGLISKQLIKDFKYLMAQRTDVDYGDMADVNRADAKQAIENSKKIIDAVLKTIVEQYS